MQQTKFTYMQSVAVVGNAADRQFVAFIYKRTVEQCVIEGLCFCCCVPRLTTCSHAVVWTNYSIELLVELGGFGDDHLKLVHKQEKTLTKLEYPS